MSDEITKKDLEKNIDITGIVVAITIVLSFIFGMYVESLVQQDVQVNQIQSADYNLLLDNQAVVANYVQQEAQCLAMMQKCKLIEDNNTGFVMGCFK